MARCLRIEYPRLDRPGRLPRRVGLDTAPTDCCAQRRDFPETPRKFFPEISQRLRSIFPPNCDVCTWIFRKIAVYY